MLPDRVSNPGLLTYESGALPIALRGPAYFILGVFLYVCAVKRFKDCNTKLNHAELLSLSVVYTTFYTSVRRIFIMTRFGQMPLIERGAGGCLLS